MEWERLNFIKWQIISLTDTIAANLTLSTIECFYKIYIEIDKIQYSINSAYHSQIYLRENIIWACQRHPVRVIGLTYHLSKTSNMVNSFYNSIINYEAVHKPSFIENYIQFETHIEENNMFFYQPVVLTE